jgi:hypothetical protein
MKNVQLRQTDSFVRHPGRAFELLLCNAIDSSPCSKIFVTQQPYSIKTFTTKLTPSFSWFYSPYLRLNYIQNCGEKFWLRHLWSNVIIWKSVTPIFLLSPCMLLLHIFKNQLMHFILKLHFLKHNHSSKTLECLCPCASLHVSVINLDHPQGYCSCCNATVHLVVLRLSFLKMSVTPVNTRWVELNVFRRRSILSPRELSKFWLTVINWNYSKFQMIPGFIVKAK